MEKIHTEDFFRKRKIEKETKKTKNNMVSIVVIILLVLATIVIIVQISKSSSDSTGCSNDVLCCIGNRSILFASQTCGYCHRQKEVIREENLDKFTIIYCNEEPELCAEYEISVVPTWVINGEKVEGFHEMDELKELTNC